MLLRDLSVVDCLLLLSLRASGQGVSRLTIIDRFLLECGSRLRLLFRKLGGT